MQAQKSGNDSRLFFAENAAIGEYRRQFEHRIPQTLQMILKQQVNAKQQYRCNQINFRCGERGGGGRGMQKRDNRRIGTSCTSFVFQIISQERKLEESTTLNMRADACEARENSASASNCIICAGKDASRKFVPANCRGTRPIALSSEAPSRFAPSRLAPTRHESCKFARTRQASRKSASSKSAARKFASCKSAYRRLALISSKPSSLPSRRAAFLPAAPRESSHCLWFASASSRAHSPESILADSAEPSAGCSEGITTESSLKSSRVDSARASVSVGGSTSGISVRVGGRPFATA